MAISLFQLGPQAWLKPQAVAQAVRVTKATQLLPWAETVPPLMTRVGMEPSRISRSQRAVKEMAVGIREGDDPRAERNKRRFANLIAGARPQQKWERMLEKSGWAQGIQRIFRPAEVVSPSTSVPVLGDVRRFHEYILGRLRLDHKPGQRITNDTMREGLLPNRLLVGDVADLVAANIEDVTNGAFATLTPRERAVIHLRYGIPLRAVGEAQDDLDEREVARLLRLSEEETIQLVHNAAQKLGRDEYAFLLWTRDMKKDLKLERGTVRQLSGEIGDWGSALLQGGHSHFREFSHYFVLKGISIDCFHQLQQGLERFPNSPQHYVVIFAEQNLFIPDVVFERAMADRKSLIREFVLSETVAEALIVAIEDRKSAPEEVARFLAQIDIREWDLEMAEYIYRGCPLDVDVYLGYREDCPSRPCNDVLKHYDLFVEELADRGVVTYHCKSSFCYRLIDYYIRQMQALRERFGLPDLNVYGTVFSSVDRFGGDIQKIDLRGILMPGRRNQRRGDEMDPAVMKNVSAVITMVTNRIHQLASGLFDPSKFEGLKTADEIVDKAVQLRKELDNMAGLELRDLLRPVNELKEAGFPLTGELFTQYAAASDRLQKMEWTRQRTRELAAGATLGSMDDPFEVIAVLRLLGERRPLFSATLSILEQAEIPARSPDVYFAPFTIPAVPLTKPYFTVANKGLLAKYVQELHNVGTLHGLVKTLKNFTGSRKARQAIQQHLDELETLSVPDVSINTPFTERLHNVAVNKVIEILDLIEEKLRRWLQERTKKLLKDRNGWDFERALEQAIMEIDIYLNNISIAKCCWQDDLYEDIGMFDKEDASQEETYRILDRLSEFYRFSYKTGTMYFIFPPRSSAKVLEELDKINHNKTMLQETGETKDITLSPVVGKLAAFYGYLSENSLARSDWAIHAMRDTGFVPYFMVVDGEVQGVVQTFTKVVNINGVKKKILIVTGVDPQLRLTPDPSTFMKGLEEGFWKIAAAGGYDLVVVPALDFAQSSRRALLRREFNRYTEKIRIDKPVGFPRVGVHEDGRPIYYHNEVHGEAKHQNFLVFRSSPSPS